MPARLQTQTGIYTTSARSKESCIEKYVEMYTKGKGESLLDSSKDSQ
jgi:hypothetical protein